MSGWQWLSDIIDAVWSFVQGRTVLFPRAGRFIVCRQIAEGGFSFVHIARSNPCAQPLVIKRAVAQDAETERQIATELRALWAFKHENIIRLLDQTTVVQGRSATTYMLFPFAENGSLTEQLPRVRWSLYEILRKFVCICKAVQVIHSQGFVHWDIKPANILLDKDLVPYLTDFGSVRTIQSLQVTTKQQAAQLQEDAAKYCTMSYRAPELFDVTLDKRVDQRTDVWALGCLLFAMMYGYSPFECEFRGDGKPRVTECTHLRVLSPVPEPPSMSSDQQMHMHIVKFILEADCEKRPFVGSVIDRCTAAMSGSFSV